MEEIKKKLHDHNRQWIYCGLKNPLLTIDF